LTSASVVPAGQALEAALTLAQQLASYPQKTMRADRMSAYAQWDLPLPQALHQEWERGRQRFSAQHITATADFGSPVDVTLQELAMETFLPADDFTRQALQALMAPA
jgi:hypothetical protein